MSTPVCDLNIPKINDTKNITLENEISITELGSALKELPNNKSPGSDGIPVEFYKVFWPKIKTFLHRSMLWSFENGELSIDQKRGVITLVPKKDKDGRFLKNWRPISLLNTDYKILTKLLANRLQNVLPEIISNDQVGYIKKRFIGDNIRIIDDIIDYCIKFHTPSLILLVDFEKAFDTVKWNFLFKMLKLFNFGPNFTKWIKVIYNDINSCVINNGYFTEFFELQNGIRQGCPISGLLFILVAEILAISIRSNPNIKGLNIYGRNHVINQLADDTTLFLSDTDSVKYSLILLENFAKVSGLRINRDKTECVIIVGGKYINKNLELGISWNSSDTTFFKTLGVWFSINKNEMIKKNLEEKFQKMQNLTYMWMSRGLSLVGKIVVLKSLILSQIINICTVIYIPDWFIEKVDKLFFTFLWGTNKRPKVNRDSVINNVACGGLKMVDFPSMVKSLKITYIKRLLLSITGTNNEIWSFIACNIADINLEKILNKLDIKFLCIDSAFYQQALNFWYCFIDFEPTAPTEIYNENLWYNKYLLVDKKTTLLYGNKMLQ